MRKIYYLVIAIVVFSLLVASVSAASPWIGNKSSYGGKTYSQTFTPKVVTPSIGIGGKAVKTYDALFTPSTTKPFMGKYKTYADAFKIPWM